MSVTLDQVFQERGEAPGVVAIEGGGALSVLVGAAGLLDQARPIPLLAMVDEDIALECVTRRPIRRVAAGRLVQRV